MMKAKKKSKFLTFCFSLLPGAAEMYMGFMKMGVSLMSLFFLIIMLGMLMNQGIIVMAGIVVWFYGFFHANHLAAQDDEVFGQMEDKYLFGMEEIPGITSFVKKYQSWIATVLILFGVCMLWNSGADMMSDLGYEFVARIMWKIGNYVPSILIGAGVIVVGLKMISGKKTPLANEQDMITQEAEEKESREVE